jgi:hypothetical protein
LQKVSGKVALRTQAKSGLPMHDPNPHTLTDAEWRELGSLTVVRESWGLDDSQDPLDLASLAYGAKFDFVSGSPGYVGDLYVLQGDALGEPMVLRRDENNQLIVC